MRYSYGAFLLIINMIIPFFAFSRASISNIELMINDSSNFASITDRLAGIEHITASHSQLLIELQKQSSENQFEIDTLRGKIQEEEYQLSKIIDKQKKILNQINDLTNLISDPLLKNDRSQEKTTNIKNISKIQNKFLTSATSNIKNEYDKAVALVLEKKKYDQAINAFTNFNKRYPNSNYQANTNYWLGQINYNQGKKNEAIYYFALVAKKYPNSSKAPDALFKIGVILQEKNQTEKARAVYQTISHLYPNNEAAGKAKKKLLNLF
ncbi:tol-pal system protein YbgF [Sodalis sp. CWE]|uniref:tol-pal system protein YbgF n=1 Tax=Sodalis sp. CWE TaxID=2803816 RepID=UPI001C7CBA3F|nr:tol-pal system protein YbgF [Sodalis sp. CWE]MBX4180940.1 tol-pal system protein YbgF [Sodalis sp. CWE]